MFEGAEHGVASRFEDFVGFDIWHDLPSTAHQSIRRLYQLFGFSPGSFGFETVPAAVKRIDRLLVGPPVRPLERPNGFHAARVRFIGHRLPSRMEVLPAWAPEIPGMFQPERSYEHLSQHTSAS